MADGPTPRVRNAATKDTHLSITAAHGGTSRASKKAVGAFIQLAHFSQPTMRCDTSTIEAARKIESRKGNPTLLSDLKEGDEEEDQQCVSLEELDPKQA
jgi:hypothetical protein